MNPRCAFGLGLALLLLGCTPTPFIVTAANTPQATRRWPNSLELRTVDAQYWITFTHSPEHGHSALVSTNAAPQKLEARQPVWLQLTPDGQAFHLSRWITRAQTAGAGQSEILCYGELPAPHCGREPKPGDTWIWRYALPPAVASALSRAKQVRVTLGLVPNPVYQDLETEDLQWLASFFQATLPKR